MRSFRRFANSEDAGGAVEKKEAIPAPAHSRQAKEIFVVFE